MRTLAACVVGSVLISAGVAAAADRCHQDLAGTRSLTLWADVTSYRLDGDRIVVNWSRSPRCAGTAVWNPASTPRAKLSSLCGRQAVTREPATAAPKLAATSAARAVRVLRAPASIDRPDRLVVVDRATNRRVASWPLFERPARVALYGDIAILSGAERHGVYALRISDGRLALIGVARPGDRPLIGQAGVVYLDDLDRSLHKSAPGLRRLVLVPLSAVRRELDRPYTTVREYMAYSHTRRSPAGQVWGARVRLPYVAARNVGGRVGADPPRPFDIGRITSISMDGPRVALAVHDPSGRCDRVFIWNVPWHYVVRLSGAQGLTCLPQHAPGGVTGVVMAGGRAAWATTYGTVTRIIAASTTACREWVVARSRAGAALAGDGAVLAYALGGSRQGEADGGTVGIVPKLWRGAAISASADSPTGISVDGGRIAALQKGGLVQIRTRSGRLAGEVRVGPARALALRERTLAVLTSRGALDVYRTPSMSHVHHWRLPANVTAIDLHYGIALLTANRDVFAMHVKTGRIVRLVRAPRPVRAQLEGPGAVIQFNLSGRGMVRFLPMSWIEAQLQ